MEMEYEVEHFGFTAEQLTLERKYFLQKIIRNALDAMVNKFNASEKTSELLGSAKEETYQNIWISMKNEMEQLNKLDTKYFTISDHVLLPQYFAHVKSYTEQIEQELDNHLDTLRKTFLENSAMLEYLKLENSQYKDLTTFVQTEVEIQEQLKESFSSINLDNINDLDTRMNNLTTDDS